MIDFHGIITPIVTPFKNTQGQEINFDALAQQINRLISEKVSAIFVLGSNGEFHVMDSCEKLDLIKESARIINKRVPLFAGTGACSTREAVYLSKKACELGADVLSIIPPYYMQPNDDELFTHYQEIALNVDRPIILYNIPKAVGYALSPSVVARLASIDKIVGIKDSSGDKTLIGQYIEICKEHNLSYLIGSDSKISYAYSRGACAAIAGTSNLIPEVTVKLWDALEEGNECLAHQLQNDLEPLRSVLKLGTVPSVIKRAITLRTGIDVGSARRPVHNIDEHIEAKIKRMLEYYTQVN